jgi:predicted unusual protein kinase regulating ubiquinone biosynthesis (AarF/ABC1/UbiB family)
VQEFIEGGYAVSRILSEMLEGKTDQEELLKQGVDVDGLAVYLIKDLMRQYFIDGFFHADPHPANLIFLPASAFHPQGLAEEGNSDESGNKLVYLDFGIIGEAKEKRIHLLEFIYGISKKDLYLAARPTLEYGEKPFEADYSPSFEKVFQRIKDLLAGELEKDLKGIVLPWYEALESKSSSLYSKSAAIVFFKIVKRAENYGARLPKEAILFFRTLSIVDMICLQISAEFNIIKAINAFFGDYGLEQVKELIRTREHKEVIEEKIEPLLEPDWEIFRERAVYEKEKQLMAQERMMELALSYADHYPEIRSLLKTIR